MKGIKLFIACLITFSSFVISAQSVLPALKDNPTAQALIGEQIGDIEDQIKSNPTTDLYRKLELFKMALSFLNEPTQIPPTTEYGLTSAFINHEVKWNALVDTEALMKYRRKQWSKEFLDLLNLVKI